MKAKILFAFIVAFGADTWALCETYQQCADQILISLSWLNNESPFSKSHHVRVEEIPIPRSAGGDQSDGTMVIWIQKEARVAGERGRLLILVSGLHGMEGFAGSTVQNYLLRNYGKSFLPSSVDLLLIHGLNGYGFRNFRRVTSNNVDLNRNFPLEPSPFRIKNEDYKKVYEFLNPTKPLKVGGWADLGFLFESLYQVATKGMTPLRNAILKGQYEFSKGIYFGGSHPEPHVEVFAKILNESYQKYRDIVLIDLHTGYGERGRLHLFPSTQDSKNRARIEHLFKGHLIDYAENPNFYSVTGAMTDWVDQTAPKEVSIVSNVFEYGTRDSQTAMGSILSLRALVRENQEYFYGSSSEHGGESSLAREEMKKLFAPSDPNWERKILSQTEQVLTTLFVNWKQTNN